MRKLLILALLFALPLAGLAVEAFDNARAVTDVVREPYLVVLQIANGDCLDVGTAGVGLDSTLALDLYPLGRSVPMPDYISIFGTIDETGTGLGDAIGDTVRIQIDVSPTKLAVTSAYWAPITHTAGSLTYASRTGLMDSLQGSGLTSNEPGSWTYTFTDAMMKECLPYFRIQYGYPGDNGADDTVITSMWITYKWLHDNTD
jgi:hypothetical protein